MTDLTLSLLYVTLFDTSPDAGSVNILCKFLVDSFSFEHSVTLENGSSSETIGRIRLEVKQPGVCGGPPLVEMLDDLLTGPLEPREERTLRFRIYGVDPTSVSEPTDDDAETTTETRAHHKIPYSGVSVHMKFIFLKLFCHVSWQMPSKTFLNLKVLAM